MRLDGAGALRFGLNGAIVATAVALLALAWSYVAVPARLSTARPITSSLFWGGGHVLQFAWTLLLLVAWLLLADAIGARVPLSPRVVALLFGIGLARGVRHAAHLSRLRRDVGRAPPAADVADALRRRPRDRAGRGRRDLGARPSRRCSSRGSDPEARPLLAALVASIALFGAGGLIGFAIHGSNVTIPAHYHGCIVGVTIALMGVAYWLLPRLGFAAPPPRLATWQAVSLRRRTAAAHRGLLWSGGYGVQRKVADGGGGRALARADRRHGPDGTGRADRDRRRHAVRRRRHYRCRPETAASARAAAARVMRAPMNVG